MENGFNPSVIVRFFRKPASFEERDEIVNGLKKSFGGVKNSGKAIVMFSDGKELAPEVTPIDVSSIDKQFTVIASQITEKILTSHWVFDHGYEFVACTGGLGRKAQGTCQIRLPRSALPWPRESHRPRKDTHASK